MKAPRNAEPSKQRGAKPGERRGGKTPGIRDKATLLREKIISQAMMAATAAIGSAAIRAMSPKDVMIFTMQLAATQGWWFKAAEIAKEVAPYVHAKLANTVIDDRRRKDAKEYSDDELEALGAETVLAEYTNTAERTEHPN